MCGKTAAEGHKMGRTSLWKLLQKLLKKTSPKPQGLKPVFSPQETISLS
jgi:hypothetical protein